MRKAIYIPNPFEMSSFKGFKFIAVLNRKAKIKTCRVHNKLKVIYFNPSFIDKLTPGQRIFYAYTNIYLFKLRNVLKADDKAFYVVTKRYNVTQDEIGELLTNLVHRSKEDQIERFKNFVTEPEIVVKRRRRRQRRKQAIINFFKTFAIWRKEK